MKCHTPDISVEPTEIIAFGCVRNEKLRLPYCLQYHRKLGIDRFVLVDNGSDDGTLEYLLAQPDTIVFSTSESYAASRCGIDWLNPLLTEYGADHWVVTLDADEMLVYPECEYVGLRTLTAFLDESGVDAMRTFLVDMYADRPISETRYKQGEPFLKYCPFFDGDSYYGNDRQGVPTRGGPRYRLFWQGVDRESKPPFLINVPLVKWRRGMEYERGTHILAGANVSSLLGAKLHFKFFSDLYAYAEAEAERKEHWDGAAQYRTYWEILREQPKLTASYSGSVRYSRSSQLVEMGLMRSHEEYRDFAARKMGPVQKLKRMLSR